ncbi:MAG: hypothetical protein ACKVOL_09840 [Novosphingobium sp.]
MAAPTATSASAQPVDDLQRADALVQSIGWRLSHANARFCPRAAPGIGLLLGDAQTYHDPAAARAAYGLAGDIAVAAVAVDSPAARAGLDANMAIIAVAGEAVGLPARQGSWDRVWALQTKLEQAAATSGSVALTLSDGRLVTIVAAPSCAVRFILDDGRGNAGATRMQVRVGRKALAQLGGDEAMIAALVAHELAHAALDHETVLGTGHRSVASVRRTEREADRLSVWLMANAGYDPEAAVGMIGRIGPRGILMVASPTHGSNRTRAREIAAEIMVLRAGPDADWPSRFQPEP